MIDQKWIAIHQSKASVVGSRGSFTATVFCLGGRSLPVRRLIGIRLAIGVSRISMCLASAVRFDLMKHSPGSDTDISIQYSLAKNAARRPFPHFYQAHTTDRRAGHHKFAYLINEATFAGPLIAAGPSVSVRGVALQSCGDPGIRANARRMGIQDQCLVGQVNTNVYHSLNRSSSSISSSHDGVHS